MAKSERYKHLKKMSIIFGVISWAALFVLTAVYVISAGVNLNAVHEGIQIFTDEAKMIVVSASVTAVIGVILTFFLKEGMRTFMWIVCVVLGSLVYKDIGMYIALGTWLLDDYVIHKIFVYYKNKLSIRKEIEYDREDGSRKEDSARS
ncbi:MAG: hypothetical protein IIX06_04555 [Bacteroidales bacterium]|nr:hypothetical protein [Bacteroidales bacterium]